MSQRPVLDQTAHFGAALVGLIPIIVHPSAFTGALAGLAMGLVREVTEQGPLVKPVFFVNAFRSPGHRLDVTFWALGGFVAGLIGWMLR